MNTKSTQLTALIKEEAKRIGFSDCGISRADMLHEHEMYLSSYLQKGFHGEMAYMANHFEKRLDPRELVEGTQSVVSFIVNYFPKNTQIDTSAPVIAKYAYGNDYHFVVKQMMSELLASIQIIHPEVDGRFFVDSAPVLERAWAVKSGLGWIGKNGNLISRTHGSFVFIAEMMLNVPLDYDTPLGKSYCGNCTRCIDACPTSAICAPKTVDGSKCLSYLTIEYRGEELPDSFKGKFDNRLFGCDICQDVCPHNRKVQATAIKSFSPKPELLHMSREDWFAIDQKSYEKISPKSAFKRTKLKGLLRNIQFLRSQDS